jgi:aminopeptidase YwaD
VHYERDPILKRRLCLDGVSHSAVFVSALIACAPFAVGAAQDVRLAADPELQAVVERVSLDSVLATLRELEALGVKAPGTPGLAATADWIQARFASYGYAVERHGVEFRSDTLHNIIATKPGTVSPDRLLLVTGHYDTARGPGVNDNGSGIAVMLEVARVLADVATHYSVRFVAFSGEEVGLVGSRAYVAEVVMPQGQDIFLVLNVDEVGGVAGTANDTVTVERDEGSPEANNAASAAHTDTLAALTRTYTSLATRIAHAWGSDYLPFEDAGYVITGFYESNESPFPHTPDDVVANLDPQYVTEVARATVAAVVYFARRER